MKVSAIQPLYPRTKADYDSYLSFLFNELDNCAESDDLILLPEVCNAPFAYDSPDELYESIERNTGAVLGRVKSTAVRCKALAAVNVYLECGDGLRNTTILYNQNGEEAARYEKQHMPVSEKSLGRMDAGYTLGYNPPVTAKIDGVRIGFLTCYDIYFSEYISHLAYKQPDIILFSAHQRSERGDIIEAQVKSCAFTCNSYVLRASVSMGDGMETGGSSMLVGPDGIVLQNMGQQTGTLRAEIDPAFKYKRPNGFGQPEIRNDLYIQNGRTPGSYLAAGSTVRPSDSQAPYPRVCSHRGFNTIAPANSMPAFAAAIALGAEEIEMDVWPSLDGEIVVCHDETVDRASDGTGRISELTYQEIQALDIGSKFSKYYAGLRFPRFEDVLKTFAKQVVINLHIKSSGDAEEFDHDVFQRIVDLIYKYDCADYVYIAGVADVLATSLKLAPELKRCCLDGTLDFTLVDMAIRYQCQKLQLYRGYYTPEMIEKAHRHGMICNLFYSNDPAEIGGLLKLGVDTFLTDDYLAIATEVGRAAREAMENL